MIQSDEKTMSDVISSHEDALQNILSRLPAKSFAAASCVNKRWNKACGQILSRPRLVSTLSLNPSLDLAVEEVLQKVLCTPIRPHFAIAFVGSQFCLHTTHHLITKTLGSNTPVITNASAGIIGKEAITNQFKEIKWDIIFDSTASLRASDRGILLIVGCVPGLKASILPLLQTKSEPRLAMVDDFVSNIQSYAVSVSGDTKPVGVMLFGDERTDMEPVVAELDQKMSKETVIVGDAGSYFICTNNSALNFDPDLYSMSAVAIVFAKDSQHRGRDIKFHVGISSGIMPCGPKLEVVAVTDDGKYSFLTAKSEDDLDILDASGIIDSVGHTIADEFHYIYIGVMQEKMPSDEEHPMRYLAFHELLGSENEVFVVVGTGIKPGDSFLFYHSDSETARSSGINVYNSFNSIIYPELGRSNRRRRMNTGKSFVVQSRREEEVFGGIMLASSNRGGHFFGEPLVDCMPLRENFPRVSIGGTFCYEPIGRRAVLEQENDEDRCCLQVLSTVYLIMTYSTATPPPALE